jgi:integrase
VDKTLSIPTSKRVLRHEGSLTSSTFNNPYIIAATSPNTRLAYQSDIRHFEKWGATLPTDTETVLAYLQAFAKTLNPRTLSRRLTALKNWHLYQGFADPIEHPSVKKTMIGILRIHGKPKAKAPALLPEHLLKMVHYLQQEKTIRAARDNALLQLAFFGGFRRSELVAIGYDHLEWKDLGIDILIPHSKTDQTNEGRYCAIPYGNAHLCPVQAIKHWLDQSQIKNGPLFRRIHPEGHLDHAPLAPLSVNNILKKRAQEAGIPEASQLSSHSFRRGLATSASRNGASLPAIMRQGRWKNVNTVMGYIEAAQRFEENAATSVLKKIPND